MNNNKNKNIIITTGGTGGHIFPAMATATQLEKLGYSVYIVTDKRGEDKFRKGKNPFSDNLYVVNSSSPQVGGYIKKIFSVFSIILGVYRSIRIIKNIDAKACVGFGSYASAPSLFASILLNRPIVLHEQNSFLGKVNRLVVNKAKAIGLSYHNTKGVNLKKIPLSQVVGMPLRKDVIDLIETEKQQKANDKFNLLITGGSQGAIVFSQVIPKALFNLPKEIREKLYVTFQARPENIEELTTIFKEYPEIEININSFYTDMPQRIANSDLLISRAGSSTISEICALGKASILVPFLEAADNHQLYNAQSLVENECAILLEQNDSFTSEKLSEVLEDLINDSSKLHKMEKQSKKLAKLNSAKDMAELIITVIK